MEFLPCRSVRSSFFAGPALAAILRGCGPPRIWAAASRRPGIRLIFGGGRVGLMGAVADAALAHGGQVLGIIPEFLTAMEVAHGGLTELVVTDSMHSRKRLMFDESDAFITLPGGLGTLDETVEIVTWGQLGLHAKPVLICNVGGWADGLLAAFEQSVTDGFAAESTRGLFETLPDVPSVMVRLAALPVPPEQTSRDFKNDEGPGLPIWQPGPSHCLTARAPSRVCWINPREGLRQCSSRSRRR